MNSPSSGLNKMPASVRASNVPLSSNSPSGNWKNIAASSSLSQISPILSSPSTVSAMTTVNLDVSKLYPISSMAMNKESKTQARELIYLPIISICEANKLVNQISKVLPEKGSYSTPIYLMDAYQAGIPIICSKTNRKIEIDKEHSVIILHDKTKYVVFAKPIQI